jgi:hypothetical protein
MAHAPIFDVAVTEWAAGKKAPGSVQASCKGCGAEFVARESARAGDDTFAVYLGALHLHCPGCGAEGPVQLRRLLKDRRR